MEDHEVKEHIKKRYGEIAQQVESCCSSCGPSCCGSSTEDAALRIGYSEAEIGSIPEDSNMGLGCGNPVALAGLKQGETVLDLGSGGGIDVFLAARKVGVKGKVIGVDMTEEMIRKAEALASEYGYGNVEFRQGEIENLPVEDGSVDVVISNCVVNLSPDKESVFREAYRVLRPDGRIMVSDIVTEGELPEAVRRSLDAWTKCVAGALEKSEYLDTIKRTGFEDVKIVSESHSNICLCDEPSVRISSIQVGAHKGTTRTT